MYCSISDAWNQENTMTKLAERFNNEFFTNNNDPNLDFYRINDNETKNIIENYANINESQKQTVNNIANLPDIVNKNRVIKNRKVDENKKQLKEEKKIEPKKKEMTCDDLINKVLSCEKCKDLMIKKLNLNNFLTIDYYGNIFKDKNKEIIILILIGLIIIILLEFFLKITRTLN